MSLVLATPHAIIGDSQGTDTSDNSRSTLGRPSKVFKPSTASDFSSFVIGAVGSWRGVEAMHQAGIEDLDTSRFTFNQNVVRKMRDLIFEEIERLGGMGSLPSSPRYIGTLDKSGGLRSGMFIIGYDLSVQFPDAHVAAIGGSHKAAKVLAREKLLQADDGAHLSSILFGTMDQIAHEYATVGGPFKYVKPEGNARHGGEDPFEEPGKELFEEIVVD